MIERAKDISGAFWLGYFGFSYAFGWITRILCFLLLPYAVMVYLVVLVIYTLFGR